MRKLWMRFAALIALSLTLPLMTACALDGNAPKLPTTIHDFCFFYHPYPYHLSDGPQAVADAKRSLKNHECLCTDSPPRACAP
jgi:hypothetical protein